MISLPENKKILFFCPHPDDDAFSSGATIHELVKNQNQVISVFMTLSPKGIARDISNEEKRRIRKSEAVAACKVLGNKTLFLDLDKPTLEFNDKNINLIINMLEKEKPDIILLPPQNDAHPTHARVSKIVSEAAKSIKAEKWFYETWTPLEKPNYIFFFGEDIMKIKIKALKQYESQLERMDLVNAAIGINTYRGIMGELLIEGFTKSGEKQKKYGEAFLIVK